MDTDKESVTIADSPLGSEYYHVYLNGQYHGTITPHEAGWSYAYTGVRPIRIGNAPTRELAIVALRACCACRACRSR